jgi:FixJ family two-component response regulator
MRRALEIQLQILRFNVLVFQSAAELLESLFPNDNACLLLDPYMPRMSRIELCWNVVASGRHLPTILMSGRNDPQASKSCAKPNRSRAYSSHSMKEPCHK